MEKGNPKTLSVPEAGRRYFGLGKNASYEAARSGEFPVIKIGGRLFVSVVAMERMLDGDVDKHPNQAGADAVDTMPGHKTSEPMHVRQQHNVGRGPSTRTSSCPR